MCTVRNNQSSVKACCRQSDSARGDVYIYDKPYKCPMKYVYLCEMYIKKQLSHLTVPTEHSVTLNPELLNPFYVKFWNAMWRLTYI